MGWIHGKTLDVPQNCVQVHLQHANITPAMCGHQPGCHTTILNPLSPASVGKLRPGQLLLPSAFVMQVLQRCLQSTGAQSPYMRKQHKQHRQPTDACTGPAPPATPPR
jgi:hypothetical protein